MNPFAIPGADALAAPPLCPWEEGANEHETYYVAIDDTASAFARFSTELANSGDLARFGWFVLVTGGEGCGKTSLINRCVTALRERLGTRKVNTTIVDTTRALAAASIEERMEWACQSVIDSPDVMDLLPPKQAATMAECCDDPPRFYRLLSNTLQAMRDRVIIILLPPSELTKEVQQYVNLCFGKIVFFAESSLDEVPRDVEVPREVRMTRLAVHPLQSGDGRRFASARVEGQNGTGPQVDTEAAEMMVAARLDGPGTSIGGLQTLLYGAYMDALQQPDPDQVVISYEYLTEYVARRVDL